MASSRPVAVTGLALSLGLWGCGMVGPDDVSSTTDSPSATTTTSMISATTTTSMTDSAMCAKVMPNMTCIGYELAGGITENTTSADECCDLCTSTADCGAFTYHADKSKCVLKRWCQYLAVEENAHSSMPEKLPETPPPGCVEPDLGIGFECLGDEIATVPGESQHECCDKCSADPDCLIYTFSKTNKSCSLKKNCPLKPANSDCITGWVVNPKQQEAARYQVGRGYYELDNYQCGGGGKATVIFYPKPKEGANERFSVVVYGHGAWGYVDGSDAWLETVASLGLIVIAPFQGSDPKGHPCKSKFADDLLNAISGSKAGGAELHPALATANWNKTGIFGHSKGAKYAGLAAAKGKDSHGVSAVVSSCDAPSTHESVTVPSMFTTGTLDKFNNKGQIQKYWEETAANPKVYVNLMDAYHMEVQEGMRLNLLTGQFLSCHVNDNQEDCDVIYGNGENSICKVNSYMDGQCCVSKNGALNEEFCHDSTTSTTTSMIETTTVETTTTSASTGPSMDDVWDAAFEARSILI